MSPNAVRSSDVNHAPRARSVDLKLEAIVIPVADVDRAKQFYAGLRWRLDADFSFDNGFRVVQFTSPGSACSVQFGTNISSAAPGSAQGLYLIVSDIEAARAELVALGAEVSDVFHPGSPGAQFQPLRAAGRVAPDATSFASISDMANALRRAAAAHGEHEKRIGKRDDNWPDWYAAYMAAEQAGRELPA